jgi:hypothetical protein
MRVDPATQVVWRRYRYRRISRWRSSFVRPRDTPARAIATETLSWSTCDECRTMRTRLSSLQVKGYEPNLS